MINGEWDSWDVANLATLGVGIIGLVFAFFL